MTGVSISMLTLLLALQPPSDPLCRGVAALEQGKYQEAQELLEQALRSVREAGREPAPALLFDLGLAQLRAGRPEAARTAFLEARARALPGDSARVPAGLGLGAALWRLSEQAEKAGPNGLEEALRLTREARKAWMRTLIEEQGAEPVRRNIERANHRIEALEERLEQEDSSQRDEQDPQEKDDEKDPKDQKEQKDPKDQEESKDRPEAGQENAPEKPETEEEQSREPPEQEQDSGKEEAGKEQSAPKPEISPEELRQLLERLEKMEARRLELERRRQPARPPHGRDW